MRLNEACAVLDARLRTDAAAPVAVAFSGGGDSLALLLIARAWAAARGRRLLALTVDHGLQPQGGAWVQACAAATRRLAVPFQALAWEGPKPERGLPAHARAARHRLLAEAARAAGARVILMGHTADDRLEAEVMRAAGATTPSPRLWSPSPVWPEGRGLFLLRPLLGCRRADLRDWLIAHGESWIDDPANEDPRFARARARATLAGGGEPAPAKDADADDADLARAWVGSAWGGMSVPRARLRSADEGRAGRALAAACVSAAGTTRPPRGERLARLLAGVRGAGPIAATLCGARVTADPETVQVWREPGEAARGGLAPAAIPPGRSIVWDGRYEIRAPRAGLTVRRLAGMAARLPEPARRALASVPAQARGALPVLVDADGAVGCPALATMDGVTLRALAHERLLAACGAVVREPA